METYLITGGTGFIGAHLAREVVSRGHRARLLTRQSSLPAHLEDLERSPGVEIARGDLLDPGSFREHLRGIQGIYHLAGHIATHPSQAQRVMALNYDVTANLWSELDRQPVAKVVYLASIFALAGGKRRLVDERSAYNLTGHPVAYFAAKRRAELLSRQAALTGKPIVFAYPSYCLGPGDALISSSRLLLLYLRRQMPVCFGGGWNAMDVRDAARGLALAMERGEPGERYLLGGVNMAFKEFFRAAHATLGLGIPRLELSSRVASAVGWFGQALGPSVGFDRQAAWIANRHWYYNDTRARRELGHRSRPLAITLDDAARWFARYGYAPLPPKLRLQGASHDRS